MRQMSAILCVIILWSGFCCFSVRVAGLVLVASPICNCYGKFDVTQSLPGAIFIWVCIVSDKFSNFFWQYFEIELRIENRTDQKRGVANQLEDNHG